jgi:membrane associated rhomboid family serine protease
VDASGYLYAMATVGMSFTGLSVLTMILRQMLGGRMTKFDSFVARTWVELGFMITFGSILPPLLALFDVSALVVWRISSGLIAIILGCWALTFPRRRLATNATRLPIPVIIFVAAMALVALALAANAIAVPVERLSGVYAASVTAILVGAAMLFLFAFVHWYDYEIKMTDDPAAAVRNAALRPKTPGA